MLHRLMNDLRRDTVVATDGVAGSVDDVYIDARRWTVRYLVVDTGSDVPGRRVLIKPDAVRREGISGKKVPVALDREQVREAPGVESDPPVSRRMEQARADYYGYPRYWGGFSVWDPAAVPPGAEPGKAIHKGEEGRRLESAEEEARRSALYSGLELVGYGIVARDGAAGRLEDLLVDDRDWTIADMVIDTRVLAPGKRVLVSPEAIESIDWARHAVRVRLTRREVEHAPRTR